MTKAGRAATDGTRSLMAQVRAENRATLIDLAASDPNCLLPTPYIANGARRKGITLCQPAGRGGPGFAIKRFVQSDFAPSLATIDGLVAYLDVVDAVVTREPLDLAGTVEDAYGTLESVTADGATIFGGGFPKPPALTADQKTAVGAALTLLSEIVDQAARVRDLRKIELARDPEDFAVAVAALERANTRWLRAVEAQVDSQEALLDRRLSTTPARDYDRRRAMATEKMAMIERKEALPDLAVALAGTTRALTDTHSAYRALLFGRGALLTDAERRKAAAITRARMRGALSSLAGLIRAF